MSFHENKKGNVVSFQAKSSSSKEAGDPYREAARKVAAELEEELAPYFSGGKEVEFNELILYYSTIGFSCLLILVWLMLAGLN